MNDETIVLKFWDRNEDAITESKKHYETYCLYIAENILYDKQDAEECLNDALLAAWNSIPPQKPKNLKTYLGKLTREIAIDRWRKNKAQKRNTVDTILSLDELEEMTGIKIEEKDMESFDTINGLLISILGHIPEQGEKSEVEYNGWIFKIFSANFKTSRYSFSIFISFSP